MRELSGEANCPWVCGFSNASCSVFRTFAAVRVGAAAAAAGADGQLERLRVVRVLIPATLFWYDWLIWAMQ